jgi:hypothetical protein
MAGPLVSFSVKDTFASVSNRRPDRFADISRLRHAGPIRANPTAAVEHDRGIRQ